MACFISIISLNRPYICRKMLSTYALSFPSEYKARYQHKLDLVGLETCPNASYHLGKWPNQMTTDPNCIQNYCYSVSSKDDFIKGSQFVPCIAYNIIAFLYSNFKGWFHEKQLPASHLQSHCSLIPVILAPLVLLLRHHCHQRQVMVCGSFLIS
mgnify:CR=1 FL=1